MTAAAGTLWSKTIVEPICTTCGHGGPLREARFFPYPLPATSTLHCQRCKAPREHFLDYAWLRQMTVARPQPRP